MLSLCPCCSATSLEQRDSHRCKTHDGGGHTPSMGPELTRCSSNQTWRQIQLSRVDGETVSYSSGINDTTSAKKQLKNTAEATKEALHPIQKVKRCIYDHQSAPPPSCNQHSHKHNYRLSVWMAAPRSKERMDLIVCAPPGPVSRQLSAADQYLPSGTLGMTFVRQLLWILTNKTWGALWSSRKKNGTVDK